MPALVSSHRVPALEGLRGLAFLMVHGFHSLGFGPAIGTFSIGRTWHSGMGQGWVGVDLFFVLSGFLITGILLRSVHRPGWFAGFYARRAARILPLYYMVLLGSLFLVPLAFPFARSEATPALANLPWYAAFLHNWLNLRLNAWPAGDSLIGQLWSLAVEEQFYLVWPIAVAFLDRRRLEWFCWAVVLATPAVRLLLAWHGLGYDAIYTLTICRADALAAGSLLALRATGGLLPGRNLAALLVAGGGVLFFLSANLADRLPSPLSMHFHNAAFTWGLAMWVGTLALALHRGPLSRLLSWAPLRFVGFHSYALYLVTYPLCFVAGTIWKARLGPVSTVGQFAFAGSTLAAGLLLACASWHLVEKRFLSLAGTSPVFRWRPGR